MEENNLSRSREGGWAVRRRDRHHHSVTTAQAAYREHHKCLGRSLHRWTEAGSTKCQLYPKGPRRKSLKDCEKEGGIIILFYKSPL